jgi:hypothetical protein
VVLPLLLIAAWFAYDIYTSEKPVYYSNAVVSIAPKNSRMDQAELGVPVPRNGLLDVGGPGLITNMAVLGLSDPSVAAQVIAGGGKADYTARMFPVSATSPELPLIMIEATESDPISAAKTVELAAAQTDSVLRNLQQQAGVPDDQMVKALVVSPPSVPRAGVPSRTRSVIYLSVVGAAIAILAGVVVDVLFMRRRKRLQVQNQTGNDTDAAENAKNSQPQNENVTADMAMDGR